MDRTEAQLKYGNALISSGVGPYVQPTGDDKSRHHDVRVKGESERRGRKKLEYVQIIVIMVADSSFGPMHLDWTQRASRRKAIHR